MLWITLYFSLISYVVEIKSVASPYHPGATMLPTSPSEVVRERDSGLM